MYCRTMSFELEGLYCYGLRRTDHVDGGSHDATPGIFGIEMPCQLSDGMDNTPRKCFLHYSFPQASRGHLESTESMF